MAGEGSITHWIHEVQEGDHVAARRLWERYYQRLVHLARIRLGTSPRRVFDEDDLASRVFESFFQAASAGRFPNLSDRDELWRLLIKMTAQKAIDLNRHDARQRRGAGKVRGESVFDSTTEGRQALTQIIGNEPNPEFVATMKEQVGMMMQTLQSEELQQLAVGKLEGFSNAELAAKFDCSERTVERRLKLIRRKLEAMASVDE